MSSQISKYKSIVLINVKESLTYIWDIILGKALFIAIIVFIFGNLWKVIFATKGEIIPGFTLPMMVWYLVFGEALIISIGRFVNEIGDEVKSGEVANYLTKPYNYLIYKMSVHFGKSIINFGLVLLLGGIVAYLMVGGVYISLVSIPFLLIISFFAMLLNLIIASIIGLFSFWMEDSSALHFIYSKILFILGGMLVPLELYPPVIEKISSILPFSYTAYHVSKLALIFSFSVFFKVLIMQLIWIILFIVILAIIYKFVIKKVSVNGG